MSHYHLITEQQHFDMVEALKLLNLVQGLAYEAETSALTIHPLELGALTSIVSQRLAPLLDAPCQQVTLN